jgi:hypothetical protein
MSKTNFRTGITAVAVLMGLVSIGYAQTFTTFDVLGSIFTSPTAINPAGQIAGVYGDAGGFHGFLRKVDGTITTFDAPGSSDTSAASINPDGQITGSYFDANRVFHGFLREPDGSITTFDVPGSRGTFPQSINPAGRITGYYSDANFLDHGFLQKTDGTITTFDVAGSTGTGGGFINPAGQITGVYQANGVSHGFLRKTVDNGVVLGYKSRDPRLLAEEGRHVHHVRRTWLNIYDPRIHQPGRFDNGDLLRYKLCATRLSA